MALFAHHPARVGALRSAAHDTDAAVRQTRRFIDDIRGTSLAVPRAVEGTRLVDAGRRPLRNLGRRAERLVPAYELQSKAARLWADMVEDFNWRVDQLNEIWDQAHPSRWQQATAAALGSPLLGALASDDEADEMLADLRRQLVARHAALETRLDAVGDQISATLDAGPGPAVDSYYRFMDDALASARRERRKAEELLATFRDRPWSQKIRDEIGAGAVSAILGLADSVITISPFGSDDPRFRDVPKISPDHMPSEWWERVLRERGLDTRGPTFNLAELSTIIALSAAPGAGPARSALASSRTLIQAPSAVVQMRLTPQQLRAVSSLSARRDEHVRKLLAYIRSPESYDNKGLLTRAPSAEVRQRIIDGRVRHLMREIEEFQSQIDRIAGGRHDR